MSKNNISGAFERARQRWHFGTGFLCRRLGRGTTGALVAALYLIEYTNRSLYYRDGHLVAFPSLDVLALRAGCNEKTMRRGINKLVEMGCVRIQHRLNDSNLYYLTVPPEAEAHLMDVDLALDKRRRERQLRQQRTGDRISSVLTSGQMGAGADTKCPTTSDSTTDLHSILNGRDLASRSDLEDQQGRMVGEEERQESEANGPDNHLSSELSQCFREARQLDGSGAAVFGRAINEWQRTPAEIREALDWIKQYGGDAGDLANVLWRPDW